MLSNLLEVTQHVTTQDSHLDIPDSKACTVLTLCYLNPNVSPPVPQIFSVLFV